MSTQNIINVPNNFSPRKYQLELFKSLDSGVRRALMVWPRRHGKDKACWAYMVKEAARVPGNYYYVFPLLVDGKRALWENVDKTGFRTLEHLPKQLIKRINNQELVIELTNGSFIRILGLDSPDNIRGIAAKGVVFSEFAYQSEVGYKIFSPAVRETNGWMIFQSTPAGKNHFYDMYERNKNNDRWFVSRLQCLWPDKSNYVGDYITPDQLYQIQHEEGFSDEEMEREYGCSFEASVKGAIYLDLIDKAKEEGRIGVYPPNDHLWTDVFMDLGFNDYATMWFRQVDGNRKIWIDYYENCFQSVAHYAQILQEKNYRYRNIFLPHDGKQRNMQTAMSTEDMFRQCLKQASIKASVITTSKIQKKMDAIYGVRKNFSQYYFNEGLCADGLARLERYRRRFDPKRQIFLDEVVHDDASHAADGLATEIAAERYDEYGRDKSKIIQSTSYSDFDPLDY